MFRPLVGSGRGDEVTRTNRGAEGISGRVKFLPLAWAGMPKTSFRKNSDSPPNAVRQVLQKRLEPPPIAIPLPDDKRVKDLNVKTHALQGYDQINSSAENPGNGALAIEKARIQLSKSLLCDGPPRRRGV